MYREEKGVEMREVLGESLCPMPKHVSMDMAYSPTWFETVTIVVSTAVSSSLFFVLFLFTGSREVQMSRSSKPVWTEFSRRETFSSPVC